MGKRIVVGEESDITEIQFDSDIENCYLEKDIGGGLLINDEDLDAVEIQPRQLDGLIKALQKAKELGWAKYME